MVSTKRKLNWSANTSIGVGATAWKLPYRAMSAVSIERCASSPIGRGTSCRLGLVVEFDGNVYLDYTIEYEQDNQSQWSVNGWSWTQGFGETDQSQWTAKINNLEIDRPVDDAVFKLTYPEGTQVAEQVGRPSQYPRCRSRRHVTTGRNPGQAGGNASTLG